MDINILQPAIYNIAIERGTSYSPLQFICYDAGRIIDLTGYIPHAQVRLTPTGTVLMDLQPVIVDYPGGMIQIGEFTSTDTLSFELITGVWSLLLETSDHDWQPDLVTGTFTITDNITRNEP
jgi:hypothetical protein